MKRDESPSEAEPRHEQAPKAERLRRFTASVSEDDEQTIAYWRAASPVAHAHAMIELAEYATQMARQTGLGKDPGDLFPGFPSGDGRVWTQGER